MKTPWIPEDQLYKAMERNEAFWSGNLTGGPLLWLTVQNQHPSGIAPVPPETDEEQWTDVAYQLAKTEHNLATTGFHADALPVHMPWLGPDQFAAWLGGDLSFSTQDNTSWTKPFVEDWADFPDFEINRNGRWWQTYWATMKASVARGKDRWTTAYPDLHTGIDALGAMRGPQRLMMDLINEPDTIKAAMAQMTRLWISVVDEVSALILPTDQGTGNWTGGWSAGRFLCLGQNDLSCLIGPDMFEEFCLPDTLACCRHADSIIYHLDGPDAIRHLPTLLAIDEINCIQWIQGAGSPLPSQWIDLLKRIQDAGKSVQVLYAGAHGGSADFGAEIDSLCSHLDNDRLFILADVDSTAKASFIMDRIRARTT
ncbi:MAG: hypothetical protein A3J97_09075 [Spirochaetes bacterium RIFOXYC1_FULL_54_7]|nr:MAG: hypothetical protein A3J97_09075 [Spirochaetes bacterium RIFOXYC1_FULL_54_7]